MRRIISVLLALAMLFSCGMVAMAEEAAAPAVGVEEIDFLARLGLMDAKADPEATITRAEMAKIVMMCLGQGENLAPSDTTFTDVNSSNQYSGYIQLANSFGIMVGDGAGKFDPNGNVTYNQMVKLLTHAIGHEYYAQAAGGYPGGYLITAANNEMLVGTTPAGEQPVSHGVAAILIKNALNIDIYDRMSLGNGTFEYVTRPGVTVLTKYFDVYEFQGVVTANSETSLSGSGALKEDQVIIDGATILQTGDTNVADYIGYRVTLYVKVDEEARYNTVVAAYPAENVVTVIDGADVMNETSETLLVALNAEGEEDEYDIDINADMIYNGAPKYWTAADLKGNFGTITMIDNDSDADADVLVVYNYKNVIVNSTKVIDNIVKTKDETEPAWQTLVIDPENRSVKTTFVDTEGDEALVEDLEEWNVISVAISEDGTVMKAIVSYETLDGTVEAFDDDTIIIDGTEYKFDTTKVAPLTPSDFGREAVFYLDFAGRIAAIDFEGALNGMSYAYLKAAGVSGTGFNRKYEMELLVDEGLTVFELANDVEFNGVVVDKEVVINDALITRGGSAIQQIVMYKLNDDGAIDTLCTVTDGTSMSKEERLNVFTLDYAMSGNVMYLKNYQIFSGGYMLSDSTKCFVVPTPDEVETAEDEDYYVLSTKGVANWAYMYLDGVKFYDINEDYEAGAVILDYRADSFDRGNNSAGTNGLVTRMYNALDEEGDKVTRIGLLNNTGMEITIDIKEGVKVNTTATTLTNLANEDVANLLENGNLKPELEVSALKVGDYVTYGYDQRGNLNRLSLLFRAGNAPTEYIELDKGTLAPPTTYPDLYNRDFLAFAPVDKVAKKAIIMTPIATERVLPTTNKTVCFKYNTTDNKITFISKGDLAEGDVVFYDLESDVIICVE